MDYVYGCQQQNLAYLKQTESQRKLVAKGTLKHYLFNIK
jgi:hypothetical protein